MKKIAIALLAFGAALVAASCQKVIQEEAETNLTGKVMTICAESEGINVPSTKADMLYKYDLVWRTGDEILVKKGSSEAAFKLTGGAGTTIGTFSCEQSPFQTGDAVEAFYPSSIVNGTDLVWPATLTANPTVPMYSKKTLSATEKQTFSFASLGSVLQLTFSTTSADIVLKSIEVKADEAISGKFTIDGEGKATVSQDGGKTGITLDLGEDGVKLGVTAKKFNIAIPSCTYHNLTITFTAKDGRYCTLHATAPQSIVYNTVNTLAISGEFKATPPAGALSGVFTVSHTKKVHFSKGNLWYGKVGDAQTATFNFEDNQFDFPTSWDANHISHFFWSKAADEAVKENWNDSQTYGINDVIFTNETEETANPDFCVYEEPGKYRTLSSIEWQYLLGFRTDAVKKYGFATVCGHPGIILLPDKFSDPKTNKGSEVFVPATTGWDANVYTTGGNWDAMESAGAVFLPAAGERDADVFRYPDSGYCWTSSMYNNDMTYRRAYFIEFHSDYITPPQPLRFSFGHSIRLVTDVK